MKELNVDIGALITHSAEIVGGRPRITETGVSGQRITGWYKLGLTAEEIVEQYEGHLLLAQIYAALSYYHLNQEEIEMPSQWMSTKPTVWKASNYLRWPHEISSRRNM